MGSDAMAGNISILTLQSQLKALKWATEHRVKHYETEFNVQQQSRRGNGMAVGRNLLAVAGTGPQQGSVLCAPYRYATAKSGVYTTLLEADSKQIDCLEYNIYAPNNLLTVGGRDGVSLWQIDKLNPDPTNRNPKYPKTIKNPTRKLNIRQSSPVLSLSWNPRVSEVLSLATHRDIKIVDCEHNRLLTSCRLNGQITNARWNPKGTLVQASELHDNHTFKVKVFDPRNSRISSTFKVAHNQAQHSHNNIVSEWHSDDHMVCLTQTEGGASMKLWDIRKPSAAVSELTLPRFEVSGGIVFMHHEEEIGQYQLTNDSLHCSVAMDSNYNFVPSHIHQISDDKNIISRSWAHRKVIKPAKGETSRVFLIDATNKLTSFSFSVPKGGNLDQLSMLEALSAKSAESQTRDLRTVEQWWPASQSTDIPQHLVLKNGRSSSLVPNTAATPKSPEPMDDTVAKKTVMDSMGLQHRVSDYPPPPAQKTGVLQAHTSLGPSQQSGSSIAFGDGASCDYIPFVDSSLYNATLLKQTSDLFVNDVDDFRGLGRPGRKPILPLCDTRSYSNASITNAMAVDAAAQSVATRKRIALTGDEESLRNEIQRIERMNSTELFKYASQSDKNESTKLNKRRYVWEKLENGPPLRPAMVPSIDNFEKALPKGDEKDAAAKPRVVRLTTDGRENKMYPLNLAAEISEDQEVFSERSFFEVNSDFVPANIDVDISLLRELLKSRLDEECRGVYVPPSLLQSLLDLAHHHVEMVKWFQRDLDGTRNQMDRMLHTINQVDTMIRYVANDNVFRSRSKLSPVPSPDNSLSHQPSGTWGGNEVDHKE